MKDHEIAQLVNELRDTAIKYRDAQQLRERIAMLVVPALRGVRGPEPLQETSGKVTGSHNMATQAIDSGAAGPIRTGDLLITNQPAKAADSVTNQLHMPECASSQADG